MYYVIKFYIMNKLLDNLNLFFESKSNEELRASWRAGSHLDSGGMKITDYLLQKGYHVVIKDKKINFEEFQINFNLGSNIYSNLFFV